MGRLSEIKRDCERFNKEEKRGAKRSSTGRGKIGRGIQQHCFLAKSKKKISSKAPKRLKDKSGKVYHSEEAMAEIAYEHFEGIGRGCMNEEGENPQQRDEKPGSKCGQGLRELNDSLTHEKVKAALKRMKKGKGVGGDKFNFEMLEKGGSTCGTVCMQFYSCAGRKITFRRNGWKVSLCHCIREGMLKTLEATVKSRWVVK